jgi:hypothetical protein
MKATFILALMVASAFWSTLGRSAEASAQYMKPSSGVLEPKECITLAAKAELIIRESYKLPYISVSVPVDALCDQIQNLDSTVDFLTSVTLAMDSFLNDDSDIESPLSIATFVAFDDLGINHIFPVPDFVRERAKAILIDHLNRSSAKIELLSRSETPEGGEIVDDNWIFHLKIGELSDHSFWSVVHRSGRVRTYNYGFN